MAQKKYNIVLNKLERELIVNGLMELHNSRLRQHMPTEDVDALFKKIFTTRIKAYKRWWHCETR